MQNSAKPLTKAVERNRPRVGDVMQRSFPSPIPVNPTAPAGRGAGRTARAAGQAAGPAGGQAAKRVGVDPAGQADVVRREHLVSSPQRMTTTERLSPTAQQQSVQRTLQGTTKGRPCDCSQKIVVSNVAFMQPSCPDCKVRMGRLRRNSNLFTGVDEKTLLTD